MYNTDMPSRAELPTSGQLVRSTLIAAGVAAALLVTVILPAEYSIDPTGAGRALGLTEMGEIKKQLAEEAEADRLKDQGRSSTVPSMSATEQPAPERRSSLMGRLVAQLLIGPASAQQAAGRTDETAVTLTPGQGAEVKVEMKRDAKTSYSWKVEGGVVNHDTHGEPHANPD